MSFLKRLFFRKDDCRKEYEILDTIGAGSFAQVKVGRRKDDNTKRAIKIISKSALNSDDVEGLRSEVDILELLTHPNIVTMYQIFDCKKTLYIVMELMTGGELFDRIVENEKYSEEKARIEVRKIAQALNYCHGKGIVHRDLKPENLLYTSEAEDAEIKIADFGLAKLLKESNLMATACGTPGYVAPEILCAFTYTEKVDVWSLGVILYIMLCGFPPFYDENNAVLFRLIQNGDYDFPSPYWDDISADAKDCIEHMLVVDPTERYSCKDVLAHRWFSERQSDKELSSIKEEIQKYQLRKKFRRAVMKASIVDNFRRSSIHSESGETGKNDAATGTAEGSGSA